MKKFLEKKTNDLIKNGKSPSYLWKKTSIYNFGSKRLLRTDLFGSLHKHSIIFKCNSYQRNSRMGRFLSLELIE